MILRDPLRYLRAAAVVVAAGATASCSSNNNLVGVAAVISVVSGADQQAAVGTGVATAPAVRVKDASGNPVGGVTVRFSIATGGGSVSGDSAITDVSGTATVGQWILGTAPGVNTLTAKVPSTTLSATVTATGIAGNGISLRASGNQGFIALVGQAVSLPPSVQVLDAFGNQVPGILVTFTVTQGGGAVTIPSATTNSNGIATCGTWTLGPLAGANVLVARIATGPTLTFTAQGLTTAPVLTATTATAQTGYLSFPVTAVPRVQVRDTAGRPLSGVPVTFTTTGDAVVSGPVALSDANGIAAPEDWRLGLTTSSTLTATAGLGAAPVTFTASGVAAAFLIDVRFLTAMTPDVRDAFVAAARRWMAIITGHLPAVTVNLPANACASLQPPMNEVVTDVVVFAAVVPIDGVGQILGSSGPCAVRSGTDLPVVGSMQFDSADLPALVGTRQIVATITHEMGHVLGFGTIWSSRGVTSGTGTSDPIFIGSETVTQWPPFATALAYTGQPVPLENLFGVGTRDVHWRESVFHAELMTGFIEAPGVPMPLSRITIASMKDLGYQVDYSQADIFVGNLLAAPTAAVAPTPLNESIGTAKWRITPDGGTRRIP